MFSCMYKNVLPAYSSAKIVKIKRVFPELLSRMYCHVFLWNTVYKVAILCGNFHIKKTQLDLLALGI